MRGEVLELLKGFRWSRYRVAYAVLYGSAARGSPRPRDADVAVACLQHRCSADTVLDLYADLAAHLEPRLHIPLDLAVLDWDPPCELVVEVFKTGILVYEANPGLYVDDMARRLMICYDWSIAGKKLRVLETAEKVVLGGGAG